MEPRLYAIGDIHGHVGALVGLMHRLQEDGMVPERDMVIFLGDYVDRGPHSSSVIAVVRSLIEKYSNWRALRGNHEQMMLDAMQAGTEDWGTWTTWWHQGGKETVASFSGVPVADVQPKDASNIPDDVLAWVNQLSTGTMPPHTFGKKTAFAHAGFLPGPNWVYTDDHDRLWIRDEFLDSDFDFHGYTIVHGHTPMEEPVVRPNRIGIDTILRGGYLTAVELTGDGPRFIASDGRLL